MGRRSSRARGVSEWTSCSSTRYGRDDFCAASGLGYIVESGPGHLKLMQFIFHVATGLPLRSAGRNFHLRTHSRAALSNWGFE